MSEEILLSGPHGDFESIKHVDENGVEYWDARELAPLLGYVEWRKFNDAVGRASRACINSGQDPANHFVGADKMVDIGSNAVRKITSADRTRLRAGILWSAVKCDRPSKRLAALCRKHYHPSGILKR